MSRQWIGQAERGSPFLIRLIMRITLLLGRPAGRLLLYPITLYFVLFSRTARSASRLYLQRVLGRAIQFADIFKHYHYFAATILDRVYLLSGRLDYFDIEIHADQVLFDALNDKRGCLLLGSHLGSFEVLRALAERRPDLRVRPLMYQNNATKINAVLNALNPNLAKQVITIGTTDGLLQVREAIDKGELVGILGDRIALDDKSVTCDFFGQSARFPAGPMLLANLLKTPVVLFFGLYEGGRRYRIHFELLTPGLSSDREQRSQQVTEWTHAYARRLEHFTRLAPYNWFNFYDFWDEQDSANDA